MSFPIVVTSHFATLSRGRISARIGNGDGAIWAHSEGSRVTIDKPGKWMLHTTDGFKRVARATLTVQPNGHWIMKGDVSRFDVIE